MSNRQPTWVQCVVCCSLLLMLSVVTIPFSLSIAVLNNLFYADRIKSGQGSEKEVKDTRPTALINGGRMQKSVFIARALHKRGFRVILVEERGWGELCAARFSNRVDRFYLVPGGGGGAVYIDAMVKLIRREKVDLFVPCSGAGTTVEDAQVAHIVRKEAASQGRSIRTLIQDADLVETLHEKDRFIELVLDLQMDAPASHFIRTPDEALELLRKPGQSPMILKAANILDDVGRGDLTNFPLLNGKGEPDWARTEARLKHGLFIPMTPKTPYIAQEFIGGSGASEWCTHATVIDGKVTAYVCCPSNDLLMTYHNATHSEIGRRALQWTETFLARLSQHPRWKDTRLTGQFSMDFIHQPSSDRLVVIECNPRVHTAIGLLTGSDGKDERLGEALQGGGENDGPLMPPLGVHPMSWWGHDLISRFLPSLFILHTDALLQFLHPLWTRRNLKPRHPFYDLEAIGDDAAWDHRDPFLFLALYHIQMPFLLLRQLLFRRKAFSRMNISTARIFEC